METDDGLHCIYLKNFSTSTIFTIPLYPLAQYLCPLFSITVPTTETNEEESIQLRDTFKCDFVFFEKFPSSIANVWKKLFKDHHHTLFLPSVSVSVSGLSLPPDIIYRELSLIQVLLRPWNAPVIILWCNGEQINRPSVKWRLILLCIWNIFSRIRFDCKEQEKNLQVKWGLKSTFTCS